MVLLRFMFRLRRRGRATQAGLFILLVFTCLLAYNYLALHSDDGTYLHSKSGGLDVNSWLFNHAHTQQSGGAASKASAYIAELPNHIAYHIRSRLAITAETFVARQSHFLRYRTSELQRVGPGELGDAVPLTPDEQRNLKDVIAVKAFNQPVSDRISLQRSLRDNRFPVCAARLVYPPTPTATAAATGGAPFKRASPHELEILTASVIIIFHNEALSTLLRTAHSVVNRSPPLLLREVILLDDASYAPVELDGKRSNGWLERNVSAAWPDGVVRVERRGHLGRLGLIRARLEGARAARGDVLVFLDSHCEVTRGWLEPVLHRIHEKRDAVVCPVIESIDMNTFQFYGSPWAGAVGSFWWSGHFTWNSVPRHERDRIKAAAKSQVEGNFADSEDATTAELLQPIRSPTMAGGLFAVHRKYFAKIGAYDEGMQIWGGENLEISFRVWQCGGTLEILPCSHVGHVFRPSHPYTFPNNRDYHGLNTKRLVDVWMDEYSRLFYMHRPDLLNADAGDLTSRKQLRARLHCNNFEWYLKHVIPEKFIPDRNVSAYGFVRNPARNLCLDLANQNEFDRGQLFVHVFTCQSGQSGHQIFSMTRALPAIRGGGQRIRREWGCLKVREGDSEKLVRFENCQDDDFHGKESWSYDKHTKQVRNKYLGECLDVSGLANLNRVRVQPCASPGSTVLRNQQWVFQHQID